MRPDRLLALVISGCLLAGCKNVDDWQGLKRRKDTTPVSLTDDGQIVASYLATLDRLGDGGAAEQAEILEATRSAYLADPSTQKRLNYAFVLAVPGHAASDAVRDLDARLALTRENESLRNGSDTTDEDRIADLNRRLQLETAEKDRLRRELERAEAKLEAIATLEGSDPRR
jgi:hypothetical protein